MANINWAARNALNIHTVKARCMPKKQIKNLTFWQLPGRSVRPPAPFREITPTDNLLFARIPNDFPACPNSDIAQMTDSRRPVADVHIADWFLAALDAVEPVLMVIGTSVKFLLVFIQRLGQKFLGLGFDHTATHMDGAFLAFESRAAFEFSRTAAASNYNAGA